MKKIVLLLSLYFLVSNVALADVFRVLNTDDDGEGSLRAAIAAANDNPGADEIEFFLLPGAVIELETGEIPIFDPLQINRPDGPKIVIDADGNSRIFSCFLADITVSRLTLRNGLAENGGAIFFDGGVSSNRLSLFECSFVNNAARAEDSAFGRGGATFLFNGRLDTYECYFDNNVADHAGGAVAIEPNEFVALPVQQAQYQFLKTTFSNNGAGGRGGAVDVTDGTAREDVEYAQIEFFQCAFRGNFTAARPGLDFQGGGAIRIGARQDFDSARVLKASIADCQFHENHVGTSQNLNATDRGSGGAILAIDAEPFESESDDRVEVEISATTFSNNEAAVDGGAIRLLGRGKVDAAVKSRLVLINVTASRNTAGLAGADAQTGTRAAGISAEIAEVTIDSCTIAGNEGVGERAGVGPGIVGGVDAVDGPLSVQNTIIAGNSGVAGIEKNADELRFESSLNGEFLTSNGSNLVQGSTFPNAGVLLAGDALNGEDAGLLGLLAARNREGVGATDHLLPIRIHQLSNNSIALDHAGTPVTVDIDQLGFGRPTGPTPDVGAVEDQRLNIVITEFLPVPNALSPNAWEWIEVANRGAEDLDMTGFVIDNGDAVQLGGANIVAGVIPAGKTAIIHSSVLSPDAFREVWGKDIILIAANEWNPMPDGGGKIGLWSSFDAYAGDAEEHLAAVDSVDYRLQNGFPLPDPGRTFFLSSGGVDAAVPQAENDNSTQWLISTTDGEVTPYFSVYQSAVKSNGGGGFDYGSPGETKPAYFDFGDLPDLIGGTQTGRFVARRGDNSILNPEDFPDYQTSLENDGPRHLIVEGLALSRPGENGSPVSLPDGEFNSPAGTPASGDDETGRDDESDDIEFALTHQYVRRLSPVADHPVEMKLRLIGGVPVHNSTGNSARVRAWADWNLDGVFESAEEVYATVNHAEFSDFVGENNDLLPFPAPQAESSTVPGDSSVDTVFLFTDFIWTENEECDLNMNFAVPLRVRFTSDSNIQPMGPAPDGEVQDHLIRFSTASDTFCTVGVRVPDSEHVTDPGHRIAALFAERGIYSGMLKTGHGYSGEISRLILSAPRFNRNGQLARPASFSTDFRIGGELVRVRGRFDFFGNFHSDSVQRRDRNADPATVQLQLRHSEVGGAKIVGSIELDGQIHEFEIGRRSYTRRNPAPMAGRYTLLVLAPELVDDINLSGDGFGTVKVNRSGLARINVRLADGQRFSRSAPVLADHTMPIRFERRNVFQFYSRIVFRDLPGVSDFDGLANWSRQPNARAHPDFPRLFDAGFDTERWVLGSRFTRLAAFEGTAEVCFDNLVGEVSPILCPTAPFIRPAIFQNRRGTITRGDINRQNGTFRVYHRANREDRERLFLLGAGVFFQKQNQIRGYFQKPTRLGSIGNGPVMIQLSP